ncbi:DUF1102 family protein [Halanaeroarchaeum sp. HSR-CO]|uniref:hypothetical protein n=1 Tax=Halanaeroarchaeum sp. HSR-CO TaxID=2866382 RepID=UPI00217D8429|nr:hypothetical protein [Halanaeroarchaeum sp. HSR-CO]UWG46458.1 DUF1102 family protein [Halanaeroarchaeum sp. HSR-CO]
MQRRKFLATVGSLTAASAAAIGTGAFTTASAGRTVTVEVENDLNAKIGLVPGSHEDVEINGDGELELDLTGTNGEGVNINSTYTWGDPNDPAADHAFKIVNNDEESLVMKMNYFFTNTGWLTNHGNGQSFIRFQLFDTGDGPTGSSAENYPHQSYNKDYSLGGPTGDWAPGGGYRFNSGEEYYMVVTVDTTGPNASTDDDLSGTASFEFTSDASISQDSWYPESPP